MDSSVPSREYGPIGWSVIKVVIMKMDFADFPQEMSMMGRWEPSALTGVIKRLRTQRLIPLEAIGTEEWPVLHDW